MSKFVSEAVELEPTSDGKLWVKRVSSQNHTLTIREAKALAKYLNSWAGFEEAGNTREAGITSITITGGQEYLQEDVTSALAGRIDRADPRM